MEGYEVLRRKYGLGNENGSVHGWKEKIKMRNGNTVVKVSAESRSCEAAVQTEDWLKWVVGG